MSNLLFNKTSHLTVSRKQDVLEVYANSLDTFSERIARVLVGVKDLEIRDAKIEECRNSGTSLRAPAHISGMEGLIIYLGAAPKIKEALAEEKAGEWEGLFLEILRAVIQCEYLLVKERGYASEEDYEYQFHKNFLDTCIYFSREPRKNREWFAYANKQNREETFFSRYRFTSLHKHLGKDLITLNSMMNDSFHELETELILSPGGEIKEVRAEIIRYPHKICPRGILNIEKLVSDNLLYSRKGDLARKVGGRFGCSHLVDIIFEARDVLQEANAGSLF